MAEKRFCDRCGVEITAAEYWTRAGFSMLCRLCNTELKDGK